MGIVIRQSFWGALFAYLGVAVGFVNAVILMPQFMSPEEIGLWRTLAGIASFLTPFALLGTPASITKFVPRLDAQQRKEAIGLFISWIIIGYFLVILVSFFFKSEIISIYAEKDQIEQDYFFYIVLLLASMASYTFLEGISKANLDISTPNFFRETAYKGLHLLIIVLFGLEKINFQTYLELQLGIYVFLILSILVILIKRKWFQVKLSSSFDRRDKLTFFQFGFFNLLNGLGTVLFTQMDKLMISKLLGLKEVAIYTIAVFITSVISIPTKYIGEISGPILSKAIHENREKDVEAHYASSAINQLIITSLVFLGIVSVTAEIFAIMPNGEIYATGAIVIFLIGLTKVVDGGFGFVSALIGLSKDYKVLTIILIIAGLLNVLLNYLLITSLGLMGAALATLITYLLFNLTQYLYIRTKFGYKAFDFKYLQTLIFVSTLLILSMLFQDIYVNVYVSIVMKGTVVVLAYFVFLWVFKPSKEIEALLSNNGIVRRLKDQFKK